MAETSSIYDHYIIWPANGTLIFNLPEQMFQMALLLLKENNCDKLFWNSCINVEVMSRTNPEGRTQARTHNARAHNARTYIEMKL